MRKPGRNDRLRRFALDERRPERRVGVRPADHDRQPQSVAALRHAGRKQAEQLARHRARPHQHRADIVAEHGRGRERETGLIEDIGLERARGEIAPIVGDRQKIREPAPFDGK